jgi:hypothetical protein
MQKTGIFVRISSVLFGLTALFHIMIGVYHAFLFGTQGPQSMYTVAYGMPISSRDMLDPARALGAGAIVVYSLLLLGVGVVSIYAAANAWRGRREGLWLNVVMVGIAEFAIVYGLILPGQLTGANAYISPLIYVLAVIFGLIAIRNKQYFIST